MWSNLPFDLLANILSFLSSDSLAMASSVCQHWHSCSRAYNLQYTVKDRLAWLVVFPTRNRSPCCYVHNPVIDKWHVLSLDFLPDPVRPVTSIGSLLLLRPTNSIVLQLVLCNPFTRQFRYLPVLNMARTNPAVGVVVESQTKQGPFPSFRVYVAGGMSEVASGGAMYEPTLEMYDSRYDTWKIVGPMPVEFAVRLTVWTPNESVYTNGVLYWMTSARAYSVMGFEIISNTWRELSVPMSDRLEFAALVQRNERLTLVGGTCGGGGGGDACVWELSEGEIWCLIEKVPMELGMKLLGGKPSWGSTKCVGGNGAICLYRELGSGMIIWREVEEEEKRRRWEWSWGDGCCLVRGKRIQNLAIKGVLLHPSPLAF
ncbi:protein UNUSUAL FLORAL ORGANS-like [Pistacia vera]|uniref:protein UNUSUAL FLORAL ORGANS-like n=1 Tax=Pistacia vera TaxID=55513 RepID=UPI00126376D9|nr:protein UNUSUAL FLORAL ORGANS-like [Pistacia vera]